MGDLGYSEVGFRLAAAEARQADGDTEAARAALTDALAQLHLRADKIPDANQRERFLTTVPENARTLTLARTWLGGD